MRFLTSFGIFATLVLPLGTGSEVENNEDGEFQEPTGIADPVIIESDDAPVDTDPVTNESDDAPTDTNSSVESERATSARKLIADYCGDILPATTSIWNSVAIAI